MTENLFLGTTPEERKEILLASILITGLAFILSLASGVINVYVKKKITS